MTEADVISHWRKGARDAMELAGVALERGKFALTLFHIHLAIEKALKAQFMDQRRKDPPMTHDLERLALELKQSWTPDELELFQDLTQYAIAARYDDPTWAVHEATSENATHWMNAGQRFLNTFLP
jgi:HEPN domain-containing protein